MKTSAQKVEITLHKKVKVVGETYAFYFLFPEAFDFIAGQYLQLTLPHGADARGTTRYFSIASSPEEEFLMLTIKKGKSSFKKELFSLEPGTLIQAFGPIGNFTLAD